MQHSQPLAEPDVLHIDSPGAFAKRNADIECRRTATGARGGAEEAIGRSRGGLTTKVHHAVDGLGFVRRLLTSPCQYAGCRQAEALTEGLRPVAVVGDDTTPTSCAPTGKPAASAFACPQAQPPGAARLRRRALPHTAHGRELVQQAQGPPPPQPAPGQDGNQLPGVCLLRCGADEPEMKLKFCP